jgi:HAD superfamily hydrolase (TIGR01549 family)
MRKAVFFDLDGTLLPLDMEMFIRLYFEALEKNGLMRAIHPQMGREIFGKAISAMIANDGRATNAEVFHHVIAQHSGMDAVRFTALADAFYRDGYRSIRASAKREPRVRETVATLKSKGYRLIVSTNPLFPAVATDQRVEWAGLDPKDFEYISYYDNSSFCKPNPGYYREILNKTGLDAQECYMVGNDVREDMCAVALGFAGFLLTNHLIGDVSQAPECVKGDYAALLAFAKGLPTV